MIKIPLKFTDFDGNPVEEDHWFHLSVKQLTRMELSTEGGLHDKLMKILKDQKRGEILSTFEELIRDSYGQRVDGKASQFYKTPEIADAFMDSPAYDALLVQLLTNEALAITFINGIMPADLMNSPEMQRAMAEVQANEQPMTEAAGPRPEYVNAQSGLMKPRDKDGNLLPWALREPTPKEQMKMTKEQLMDVMRRQSSTWKPPEALASELSGQ